MSVDLKGTEPGVAQETQSEPKVNMKCRRCPSIEAVEIKIPGNEHQRLYRCVECSHSWGINVGGGFNILW